MATKDLVTVKVTRDSRRMLRLLAAHSGVQLCEELEDILWQKMKSKKLTLSPKPRGRD